MQSVPWSHFGIFHWPLTCNKGVRNPICFTDSKVNFVVFDSEINLLWKYSSQTLKTDFKIKKHFNRHLSRADGCNIDGELGAWRKKTTLIPIWMYLNLFWIMSFRGLYSSHEWIQINFWVYATTQFTLRQTHRVSDWGATSYNFLLKIWMSCSAF